MAMRGTFFWFRLVCFLLVLIAGTREGSATSCASVKCAAGRLCQMVNGTAVCACAEICATVYSPVCASDGNTYGNECDMHRHACANNKNFTMVHDGQCGSLTSCSAVTCAVGQTCKLVNGSAVCACVDFCTKIYAPLCASDGNTYNSECEMNKHACNNKTTLTKVHSGSCGSSTPCASINCTGVGKVCSVVQGSAVCACADICAEIYAPVCASNHKTYPNMCDMSREACKQELNLTVIRHGKCVSPCDSITCTGVGKVCRVVEGAAVCACSRVCTMEYAPLCASNHKTYANMCHMTTDACTLELDLTVIKPGACDGQSSCPQVCTAQYEPVCGSDWHTYSNPCQMEVKACNKGKKLHIVSRTMTCETIIIVISVSLIGTLLIGLFVFVFCWCKYKGNSQPRGAHRLDEMPSGKDQAA